MVEVKNQNVFGSCDKLQQDAVTCCSKYIVLSIIRRNVGWGGGGGLRGARIVENMYLSNHEQKIKLQFLCTIAGFRRGRTELFYVLGYLIRN
jgi:hypothetical protein